MLKHKRFSPAPPPADVVRCVVTPDNRLIADVFADAPTTQSLWLGAFPDVLKRAVQHQLASAQFGKEINAEALLQQCRAAHDKAALQTLSLAHKSRSLVLGQEAVMAALERETLACLIIAEDAGKVEARRLQKQLAIEFKTYHFGSRQQLGKAVGRQAQVFIGARHSEITEKLMTFLRRSTRFREDIGL